MLAPNLPHSHLRSHTPLKSTFAGLNDFLNSPYIGPEFAPTRPRVRPAGVGFVPPEASLCGPQRLLELRRPEDGR
eukprot:1539049-Pyramimonas_sp.AAC.1